MLEVMMKLWVHYLNYLNKTKQSEKAEKGGKAFGDIIKWSLS